MKNIQEIHKPRREHKYNTEENHQTTTGKTKRTKRKSKTNWENKVKMAINAYLPIIPLKVDRLNAPIRRHRVPDLIKKPEPTTGCPQEPHFGAKDTRRLKVSGERPREPVCLCPSDPRCSRGPKKAAPECFIWPLIKEAKNPGWQHILQCPTWGPSPSGERIWAPLGPGMQLPLGDKWPPDPLFQHPLVLRLPSWPRGPQYLTQATAPPAFVLFPLLKSPLSLSTPSVSKGGRQAATASLLSACETCSFWRVPSRGGEARLTLHGARATGLPLRFRRETEVPPSGRVVAGSLTVPTLSPLFPAPKRSPAGKRLQQQTAVCSTRWMLHTAQSEPHPWVAVPQTINNGLVSGLGHRVAADRAPPPSLALSGSAAWCLSPPAGAGRNSPLCFSAFSAPPPCTSSSVLTPTPPAPLS